MGIIIAKFRKKKTTEELLEKVDKEIKTIESFRRDTEQAQKKIVGRFLLGSFAIYFGTALIIYFYFFPETLHERIWYTVPLLLVPFLIVLTKRALSLYYNRRITKNATKLKKLNEEKSKILENVMETETYKVAKKILEKYAPDQIRKNNFPSSSGDVVTPVKSAMQYTPSVTGLRQRPIQPLGTTPIIQRPQLEFKTPARPFTGNVMPMNSLSVINKTTTNLVPSNVFPSTPLPLPRAILPRERTIFDKMADYLVGDGPSNRYALICKQCSSHNGMALKEEFEYLSFRCCYCFTFNPARKKRPLAPKLELELDVTQINQTTAKEETVETSESEKSKQSTSDTDSDRDEKIETIERDDGDEKMDVDPSEEEMPNWETEKSNLETAKRESEMVKREPEMEERVSEVETRVSEVEDGECDGKPETDSAVTVSKE